MPKPSVKERLAVNLRANRALGKVKKDNGDDEDTFIEQCVSDLTDSGEVADEDEARDVCQLLWDQGGDLP